VNKYFCCCLNERPLLRQTLAVIVNIAACVIDNFAVDRLKSLHACTSSDGKYSYGHSYAFSSAASCYTTYSFDHYDCYCVSDYNTTETANGVMADAGVTCVNLNGALFNDRSSTQGCSILFTSWIPNLAAAAYFDIFATFCIFVVCVLSSILLCCPSALGRLSSRLKKYEEFEEMSIH
jgi:hypothetical protein